MTDILRAAAKSVSSPVKDLYSDPCHRHRLLVAGFTIRRPTYPYLKGEVMNAEQYRKQGYLVGLILLFLLVIVAVGVLA